MMNGVAYQLLWSLLRCWKATILGVTPGPSDLEPEGLTLILEPVNGGDLRFGSVVEQIKSRPSNKPWSLEEVIGEVLPDLYRASRGDTTPNLYRLVTEGSIGQWEDIYEFFGSLRNRRNEGIDPLSILDHEREFASAKFNPGLAKEVRKVSGGYTERGIFLYIAHVLREGVTKPGKAPRKQGFQDPPEVLQRNLLRLLVGFSFEGSQMGPTIEADVLDELSARGVTGNLEQKLDSLMGNLLRRARHGQAVVERDKFLADHRLQALDLRKWDLIVRESQIFLARCLNLYGYGALEDCRERKPLLSLLEAGSDGPSIKPPVVVWGESGQGKSWLLYGAADVLAQNSEVVLILDSTQDIRRDREEAARLFCERIWGHDERFSLHRLAQKVRSEVIGLDDGFWLTLFIDGVTEPSYLAALPRQEWGAIGIRVAVAFTSDREEQDNLDRDLLPFLVRDFTHSELLRYLRLRLDKDWSLLPEDIFRFLRRPLWARLYRDDVAEGGQWQSKNEYQLIERYWTRQAAHAPIATDALTELASFLPESKDYPWSFSQLRNVGIGEIELERLRKTRLIKFVRGGRLLKLWHERLLQWAIAEGLASGLRAKRLTSSQLQDRVRACVEGESGQRYGYVAMDVLWLLAEPGIVGDQEVLGLLQFFESIDELLDQVVTLGGRIVPHLFSRLRQVLEESSSLDTQYIEILRSISDPSVSGYAIEMLNESQISRQQAAARILASRESPDALDRLWDLYREWSIRVEANDAR